MTRDELNGYRKELLTLAAAVDRGLAHDRRELRREDEPDIPGGPMPSTEDRLDAGAQEVGVGLIANEQHLLAEVVAALDRIDDGTFGACQECGRRIAKARLESIPYAPQCMGCARAARPVAR
jgi:RNA polymerase-binding transcription factor DksA